MTARLRRQQIVKAAAAAPDVLPPNANLYVEINLRLSRWNGIGAGVITALMLIAVWGEWRRFAIVAAIQAFLISFNIWTNLVYLPRKGRSAEAVRTAINVAAAILCGHLAGWPMPMWLILPFIALAFDHLDQRVARWALAATCVGQDVAALLDGVPWIYPLSFTVGAVFCSEISRLRYLFIRDMLRESQSQRQEIQQTAALLQESHEQFRVVAQARLQLEAELRQSQKLESVGRLAAGVAHEINTPVQFVSDSLGFLEEATDDLVALVGKLRVILRSGSSSAPASHVEAELAREEEAADLPYLLEQMPVAFERSREGLNRVATIVRSMKEFAHPDQKEMTSVDINHALETTLVMARSEYKMVADVETRFGSISPVNCYAGDLNQVLLNIVVNAAHAIEDAVRGTDKRGLIRIETKQDASHVTISIGDTGTGVAAAIRDRIFDPFFTTKEVGRGTGQGLAIARSVIVDKHGGQLTFDTVEGQGTTFFVRLPIMGKQADQPRGQREGTAASRRRSA